ncbi:F0F1 ATP synthase subunit B [bacterium]|nr:F0F1 ATP synthase subunit B [bacterium]
MIDLFYSSIGDKLTEIVRDAFGVNLLELIINLVATVILILIVRFVFWDKVTKFLDKKKENIKNTYKETDEIKEEANRIKEEADKTLADSKNEAKEIIRTAEENATKVKQRIIEDAKTNANEIIENSKEEALREKEDIIKEAKSEVVDIASLIASKMIDENIDQSKYNDSILKDLEDNNE